jgi:hypothetical protein
MLQIGLILLATMASGLGVAFFAAARAPRGYENESGFHLGPETPERADEFHGAYPEWSH